MRTRRFLGLVIGASLAAVGCVDDSVTGIRALMIEITVDPTVAAVDQVVTAQYTVEGTDISRVMVDWGDGVIDSIPYAGGLVRVAGPIDHQYAIVGTYEIVGTVEAANGVLSDQASIEIN